MEDVETRIIEATNEPGFNYGKFMLGRMDHEWNQVSAVDSARLVAARGWSHKHLWVMDLQTGEAALFMPGGHARNDLAKHKIWVCPLFEPFLTWLYEQDLTDLGALPAHVRLEAESDYAGYRRTGEPEPEPGTWSVQRVWSGIDAETATDAIAMAEAGTHDSVQAVRVD